MKWNVAIEVRNSAWVTWKKTTVEAMTEGGAEALAREWCAAQTDRWTREHEDYCPQDWTFKVIGAVPA